MDAAADLDDIAAFFTMALVGIATLAKARANPDQIHAACRVALSVLDSAAVTGWDLRPPDRLASRSERPEVADDLLRSGVRRDDAAVGDLGGEGGEHIVLGCRGPGLIRLVVPDVGEPVAVRLA